MTKKERDKKRLLCVLADGDGHSRELFGRVHERYGNDRIQWLLYPALRELESEGFVTSHEGEPVPERGNRPRRYYSLTDKGRLAAGGQ